MGWGGVGWWKGLIRKMVEGWEEWSKFKEGYREKLFEKYSGW